MTKIMARVESGVVVNLIQTSNGTKQTDTLLDIPEGQQASIGGNIVNGVFYSAQPYPSWTRGETEWLPPVPKPESADGWDEDAQAWVILPEPPPGDVWDEEAGDWVEVTDETV